jgi:hypothetical protein
MELSTLTTNALTIKHSGSVLRGFYPHGIPMRLNIYIPFMPIKFPLIILFGALVLHAQISHPWSFGLSAGMLSGFGGVTARYWGTEWGAQASLLPALGIDLQTNEFEGAFAAGAQLMRPLQPIANLRHEPGGYVQSISYPFGSLSVLRTRYFTSTTLGGGFGVETRWRHWRLASGVGLCGFLFKEKSEASFFILPSLDFSLTVGI